MISQPGSDVEVQVVFYGGFEFLLLDANVSLSDGLFEVVLIKAPDSLADLLEITGTLLSGDLKAKSNRHVKMFSTRKVTFTFSEKTGWTLDGEFAGNVEKATISVKKQKIKLLK